MTIARKTTTLLNVGLAAFVALVTLALLFQARPDVIPGPPGTVHFSVRTETGCCA